MLGIRIRTARLRAGLSQSGLAKQLGVSRTAVANWESSTIRIRPASERLEAISRLTNTSWEWLATGRGQAALDPDTTLAVDLDLVDDPIERRLLQAFRHGGNDFRQALLMLAEAGAANRQR